MLPVHEVQPLAILDGVRNGLIPPRAMVQVALPGDIKGQLLPPVADHLAMMMGAIRSDLGVILTAISNGDIYRSLAAQDNLFRQRYSPTPIGGQPTKQWNGRTYWLKHGVAEAATPGTSNHGWGRAIDLAEFVNGARVGISDRSVKWLCDNADRFGFSAELQKEPWHWRYFWGDQIPAPQPSKGMKLMIAFVRPNNGDAVYLSVGTGIRTWMQNPQELEDHKAILRFHGYTDADFEIHIIDPSDLAKYGLLVGPDAP